MCLILSTLWCVVLAVWGVGGRGDRRPSPGQGWRADVCPLSGGEGILERPAGEGLRQVRPSWDLTQQLSCHNQSRTMLRTHVVREVIP